MMEAEAEKLHVEPKPESQTFKIETINACMRDIEKWAKSWGDHERDYHMIMQGAREALRWIEINGYAKETRWRRYKKSNRGRSPH